MKYLKKLWNKLFGKKPASRTFYIEVGKSDMSKEEIAEYINKMKEKIKKTPVVDQNTGQLNLKYNQKIMKEDYPGWTEEDIWIPSPKYSKEDK